MQTLQNWHRWKTTLFCRSTKRWDSSALRYNITKYVGISISYGTGVIRTIIGRNKINLKWLNGPQRKMFLHFRPTLTLPPRLGTRRPRSGLNPFSDHRDIDHDYHHHHRVYFDHHQDHKMHKQLRMMMCIRACGNIGTTFEALKQHSTATTYHEQVRDHILRKLGLENILCLYFGRAQYFKK